MRRRAAVLLVAVALAGCVDAGIGGRTGSPAADPDALAIVATTTVIADLAANVGGPAVSVRSLVPRGGEVHTFDPSPGDVAAVAEADLLLMNGLGLDEWALDVIEGSGTQAEVVELAEDLEGVDYVAAEEAGADHGGEAANPHLWLNAEYASRYVDRIEQALAAADPDDTAAFETSADAYRDELAALHAEIAARMAAIPEENRRIVSFHEAFPYFAEAYGLDVVGVVVEAPGQDPSAGEIAQLVDAIRSSGARAVLAEAQFDDRLAETIAAEAGVEVESGLYNDSLGDPPADTYVGMMRVNVERIEAALR